MTQKKFDAALYFYKNLIKPTSSEYGYGKEIIRQMVKTKAVSIKICVKKSDLILFKIIANS